jgi:hypothetical protein
VEKKASCSPPSSVGILLALGLVPLPHLVPTEGWTQWVWLIVGIVGLTLAVITIGELL